MKKLIIFLVVITAALLVAIIFGLLLLEKYQRRKISYSNSVKSERKQEKVILSKVRKIVHELFRALGTSPSALAADDAESGRRLRRYGFDFLIDDALEVWLIEVDDAEVLKGAAPKLDV